MKKLILLVFLLPACATFTEAAKYENDPLLATPAKLCAQACLNHPESPNSEPELVPLSSEWVILCHCRGNALNTLELLKVNPND